MMVADFSDSGKQPSSNDLFRIIVSGGAITFASFFSELAGSPSGPPAAFTLSSLMAERTSVSLKTRLSMNGPSSGDS